MVLISGPRLPSNAAATPGLESQTATRGEKQPIKHHGKIEGNSILYRTA